MVGFPASIEEVGETKIAVLWGGGGEGLPALVLITGAAEGDDTADFGVLRKARRGRGSVRTSGENDVIPAEVAFVGIEKVAPLSLWVFLCEVFYELEGALLDRVRFRNGDLIAVVFPGACFESDIPPAVLAHGTAFAANAKPFIGIVDANDMEAVAGELVHEFCIVAHEPDHELSSGRDPGVHARVLNVGRLSGFRFDEEADLGVRFYSLVDLIRTSSEIIALRFGVIEAQRGRISLDDEAEKEETKHGRDTGLRGASLQG